MNRKLTSFLVLFLTLISFAATSRGQECAPPRLIPDNRDYNIFSPDQEMVLGDLTYQKLSGEWRFVKDPRLLAYINNIGDKLVAHLPPTGLKFQFFIVDLPEANAFNVPGGYVFITRKLISFANNEDELAGVIAHELGHAVVRHGAIDFSKRLKRILNVTKVGDRKDIAEKYNLVIERRRTKGPSDDSIDSEQSEADRVGLFALIAAGYDPNGFAQFFSRLVEAKGKTGNWFTDIFGKAKPEEKRLGEMIKVSEKLPQQCRQKRDVVASKDFLAWQADVVSFREANKKLELAGLLWKKELTSKLRSDISHFASSPDGKYFLTQDDFGITIVQREPLQALFQIPTADKARPATFTPDNQFIVYVTEGLRFEKWSITDRKPVAIRELVVRRDCWERELSPGGKHLACVDFGLNLNVIDTETGKKVWEKKNFYQLSIFELISWITASSKREGYYTEWKSFFRIEFSPDSRYVMISRSSRYRFVYRDAMFSERTPDTLIALDLNTLKPVGTGGELKSMTRRPFVFLDSTRILAMSPSGNEDAGIFSFPEGKRLAKFPLSGQELKTTGNPNYVVVKPLAKSKMGILNLAEGTLAAGLDKTDATLWNDLLFYESVSGTVLLSKVSYDRDKKALQLESEETLEIPVGPIANLETVEVSDNFKWLAVSSKTRGAVWDLTSGDRKLYMRGFRGAVLADSGRGIGDFPRLDQEQHNLAVLNPQSNTAAAHMELPERGARQYRQFVLLRQSLKESKNHTKAGSNPDDDDDESLNKAVRFQLLNIFDSKAVWAREFPEEAPEYFFDEGSGRLILYWSLGSNVGKKRLKEDPALAARAKELGNKDDDYLVEIVDAFAGKTVGTLLVDTGKGSFEVNSGYSEGDWLVLRDTENRVLVFSIKQGNLQHRFFGASAAISPLKNQLIVENYPAELTLYDLTTGDSLNRLVLDSDATFVKFALDGRRLFVLSAKQTAYAFDVDKLAVRASQ